VHAAERLKLFRTEVGLSQEALAERLACDQTYVGLVERGKRKPGTEFTSRLEALSASWQTGPIRSEEWLEAPLPEPVAPAPEVTVERAKARRPGYEDAAAERALQTVGHDHPFADDITETDLEVVR
jgi:transcriptional regulator with XRE-family HTH domain